MKKDNDVRGERLYDMEKSERVRESERREREASVEVRREGHDATSRSCGSETKGSDDSTRMEGRERRPLRSIRTPAAPRPCAEILEHYSVFKTLYPDPRKNSSVFLAMSDATREVVVLKSVRLDMRKEKIVADVYAWVARTGTAGLIRPIEIRLNKRDEQMDLVLPYVKDSDVVDQVLRDGPFEESVCQRMIFQVAKGLAELHDEGVVHRDISGENVLLSKEGGGDDAVLIDFGSCRMASDPRNYDDVSGVKKEYVAPELLIGCRSIDFRKADVFSLGCVLYVSLFGHPPFEIPHVSDARFRVMKNHGLKVMLRRLGVNYAAICSGDAIDALERMLSIDPAHRLSSRELLRHSWFQKDLLNPSQCEDDRVKMMTE